MSRLMSVAFTEAAVVARTKTVTRRKGWWEDRNGRRMVKPGDHLTLCRKVMGRKPDEPLVRLCEVEIVSVRREPLCAVAGPYVIGEDGAVTYPEMVAEGFPDMDPYEFMQRYFIDAQGIRVMDLVTRIEWRYLDPKPDVWGGGCECWVTPESEWLSAASCGYGGGYEPGSQVEFNPDCPMHAAAGEDAADVVASERESDG